ncbi:MAG: DUF2149 domain-containing protein [Planctomycetes bacterium]|nr:DUF2149 domain-containing protein [Planctomycetota bacterium]
MAARRSNAKIASYDDDPLSGMANMFDLGMVFSVALLVAMVSAYSLPELLSGKQDMTLIKNPGTAEMEIIKKQGMTIKRLRISEKEIGGEGERLGTAYRLKSGEVVYIPETAKPPTSKP